MPAKLPGKTRRKLSSLQHHPEAVICILGDHWVMRADISNLGWEGARCCARCRKKLVVARCKRRRLASSPRAIEALTRRLPE